MCLSSARSLAGVSHHDARALHVRAPASQAAAAAAAWRRGSCQIASLWIWTSDLARTLRGHECEVVLVGLDTTILYDGRDSYQQCMLPYGCAAISTTPLESPSPKVNSNKSNFLFMFLHAIWTVRFPSGLDLSHA